MKRVQFTEDQIDVVNAYIEQVIEDLEGGDL